MQCARALWGWDVGTPCACERWGPRWSRCRCSRGVSPHPRKGRRPTLILRTQLSVRVHAIIGESRDAPSSGLVWVRQLGPPRWWGIGLCGEFWPDFL